MNKHLMLYQNHSQYVNPTVTPNVSYCVDENHVHYLKEHDYSKDYLTFILKTDLNGEESYFTFEPVYDDEEGNILANNSSKLQYSLDNGTTWRSMGDINLSAYPVGLKILFKGLNLTATYMGFGKFSTTGGRLDVEGNIMSLFYGDNFADKTDFSEYYDNDNIYLNLFSDMSVQSAENLILPLTTLTPSCYADMFNSSYLTIAPKLPATTLAQSCYMCMFWNCTSLTTAPELSAMTLANNCYSNMFNGCTSLTAAPDLPATTLVVDCYNSMFANCTSLTTAPELPATTLADRCYDFMFYDSGLTEEAVTPLSFVGPSYCNGMYAGCNITTHSGKYSEYAYNSGGE